jgi:hypothetical protein
LIHTSKEHRWQTARLSQTQFIPACRQSGVQQAATSEQADVTATLHALHDIASFNFRARAHRGNWQLQRNSNLKKKKKNCPRFKQATGFQISCSHHLKWVCLSADFVHFFKSLRHLLSSTISSEPGKGCFAKELKILQ